MTSIAYRSALLCACTLALAGCETVSLDQPAPIVSVPAAVTPAPASAAVAASTPTPASTPAAEASALQGAPTISVQPLAPASAASTPEAAASGAAPAASAPLTAMARPPQASAPAPASSAPTPPQAGASAPALPPGAVRYICGDRTSFVASFGDVSVTLVTALGRIQLEQTVAADGARYANGNLVVWFKGREATVNNLLQPGTSTLCVEQR